VNRFISFTLLSMVIVSTGRAQNPDNHQKTRYAVEINQFITGSGFKSGSEIYVTVIPDNRKQISLGIYYCSEYKKITGISIHHEVALIRRTRNRIPRVTPYAFYDLIYRKNTIRELLSDKSKSANLVTYASMEHHLGIGARLNLGEAFSIKSELGYGVYLGSIKKPSAPDPVTGEITGTNGFGMLGKIGICYSF
jgi:hypothetical protein